MVVNLTESLIVTKISFVVPSWHYYLDPFKHQPYWEVYYATILKQKGFDVDIVDLRVSKKNSLQERVDEIEEKDFYFYWIFKTGDASETYSIANILKEKYPNSKHVAGGTHVDMCQDECVNYFDAIVVGAGENSFANFINDTKNGKQQKIYFQDYKTQPFSDTPFPDRSLLKEEYVVNNKLFDQYEDLKGTLVYFSRGCVFKCAYCTYNVPNLLQVKSDKLIKEEIKYLKNEYGIKGILVKDEIAISPNKRISDLTLNAIKDSDVVWRGQTISIAKLDQLKLAKDSGCLELAVGVETVDNNVMKIIDKTWQSDKDIKDFIENCKKVDINIKICLILGLPGEPKDILEKTIKFLEDTEPEYVSVSGFLPNPGSPIAKNYKKYGIKTIDTNWNKYGHLMHRFSEEEEIGLPFEYEKETPWGSSFTPKEISNNIIELQNWLRDKGMIY